MLENQFKKIDRRSRVRHGVTVVTMPLKEKGYLVNDADLGAMIFVKSGLPRKERIRVIRTLLRRSKDA